MTRGEQLQQVLERADRGLVEMGRRLLAWYESAALFSGGVIPFRPIKPRILGSVAAVVALVLSLFLLNASFYAGRRLIRYFFSESAADATAQPAYVLRCTVCGAVQRVGLDELDRVKSRDGLYWCESCRRYSAYRVRIGDACIAMPFHVGESP
jgi:hypothetical protein